MSLKAVLEALARSSSRFAFVSNHTHASAALAALRASHTHSPVIEETILHDAHSTNTYLGLPLFPHASTTAHPESHPTHSTEHVTKLLAGRALTHARHHSDGGFGLASYFSRVSKTSNPFAAESDKAELCVALWAPNGVYYEKRQLDDKVDKLDDHVDSLVWSVLSKFFGLDKFENVHTFNIESILSSLAAQHTKRVLITSEGTGGIDFADVVQGKKLVLLSGSFNPLHEGHARMLSAAAHTYDSPSLSSPELSSLIPAHIFPAFELSVFNVDKPPLAEPTMAARASQFAGRWNIFVTNAPTFIEKSRLFPGAVFVVGYDTAVRIIQKKYYGDSQEKMEQALNEFRDNGCTFLVAGRLVDGAFKDASDLEKGSFGHLFRHIPSSIFRFDISSTEIRAAGGKSFR